MIKFSQFKIGIFTFSLLAVALIWAPVVDAAPKEPSDTTGKSDMNRDGVVDYADIVLFSTKVLAQSVDTVDWCAFYNAIGGTEDVYGRTPEFYVRHYSLLLPVINTKFGCDLSDVNKDYNVNIDDLAIFGAMYLEMNWDNIDWCAFYVATSIGEKFNSKPTTYYAEHFRSLLSFIKDYYQCDTGPLALTVENKPKSLVRMTAATDGSGQYYISDNRVGSVFVYDSNLQLTGELKNLDKPLGIAIDSQGYLLVGNDGRNNIEVYDPIDGSFLISFGDGLVKMPTSITIGPDGKIYVTDSRSHNVHVFDPAYISLGTIGSHGEGESELSFPVDSVIVDRTDGSTLLYVADQGNHRLQVYGLDGVWLESIYFEGTEGENCNWFTGVCEVPGAPAFTRLQALDTDSQGRLHVLDIFSAQVLIMNADDGEFLDLYGEYGNGVGLLKNPIDILVTAGNSAKVTDSRSDTVEVLAIP
jgi:DNA-binding beta-propeller fold protein YncE